MGVCELNKPDCLPRAWICSNLCIQLIYGKVSIGWFVSHDLINVILETDCFIARLSAYPCCPGAEVVWGEQESLQGQPELLRLKIGPIDSNFAEVYFSNLLKHLVCCQLRVDGAHCNMADVAEGLLAFHLHSLGSKCHN